MPKEIVKDSSGVYLKTDDGNEYQAGSEKAKELEKKGVGKYRQRGVHVGWAKHQYVEIGVTEFNVSNEEYTLGQFVTLDRAGLNRLIKNLKRAGKQVFGEDEW